MPPPHEPPSDRRASVAVGLAPVFVLVVFSLIISGAIAFDTGLAISLACTAWVVYEMSAYQRAIDAFNLRSVQDERVWRNSALLQAVADAAGAEPEAAREAAPGRLAAQPLLADQRPA
ncbi:MAG: hypothetical protein HS128_02275 [Ideonella sp.]|nr:hypothetical protein [Ideonella sp.]MCC7458568.1 hypothetical protein [Nitrospira sp.]